jgi:hypothetical protein
MTSGLAPAIEAVTDMVGMSMLGRGETGNRKNAVAPDKARPAANNAVAIGRRMKRAGMLMKAVFRRMPDDKSSAS